MVNYRFGHNVYTYSWYFNDTLITGATQATFNASQTGEYRVEIEIPLAGSTCVIEDTIVVTLSSTQSADAISNYELCDDSSGDEIELFDLSRLLTSVSIITCPTRCIFS